MTVQINKYRCPQCGKVKYAFNAPLCKGKRNPQHAQFHLFAYRMKAIRKAIE